MNTFKIKLLMNNPLYFAANLSITLTNLLRQSFSPPIIPASTVIPANAGISLDVRSLPEGTYLLQIKDRNKSILKTERTVIVR